MSAAEERVSELRTAVCENCNKIASLDSLLNVTVVATDKQVSVLRAGCGVARGFRRCLCTVGWRTYQRGRVWAERGSESAARHPRCGDAGNSHLRVRRGNCVVAAAMWQLRRGNMQLLIG